MYDTQSKPREGGLLEERPRVEEASVFRMSAREVLVIPLVSGAADVKPTVYIYRREVQENLTGTA